MQEKLDVISFLLSSAFGLAILLNNFESLCCEIMTTMNEGWTFTLRKISSEVNFSPSDARACLKLFNC